MNKVIRFLLGFCLLLANSVTIAELPSQSGLLLKPTTEHSLLLNAAISILVAAIFLGMVCFCLLWWRKRWTPNLTSNNEYTPVIKTTKRITQKTTLVTIAWRGKVYLIAENQAGISVLDSAPAEVSAP